MNPESNPSQASSPELTGVLSRSLVKVDGGSRFDIDISPSPHIKPKDILTFVTPYLAAQNLEGIDALEINIIDPHNLYFGSKFEASLVEAVDKGIKGGVLGGISLTHAGETKLLKEAVLPSLPEESEFLEAEFPAVEVVTEAEIQPEVRAETPQADLVEVPKEAPTEPVAAPEPEPAPKQEPAQEAKPETVSAVTFLGRNTTGKLPYYLVQIDASKGDLVEGLSNRYPLKDFSLLVQFVGEPLSDEARVSNLEKIGKLLIDQGGVAALEMQNGESTVFASTQPEAVPVGKKFGVPTLPSK